MEEKRRREKKIRREGKGKEEGKEEKRRLSMIMLDFKTTSRS